MIVRNEFQRAIEHIDAEFGKGYAKANPQLVGAWLQAAATIDNGNQISKFIGRSDCMTVAEALHNLYEAVSGFEDGICAEIASLSREVGAIPGPEGKR